MDSQPEGSNPFEAWWRRRSWKGRAAVVVGSVFLALFLIGLTVPTPEEEAEDKGGEPVTTTVVVTETVGAAATEPPAPPPPPPSPPPPAVAEVVDGDTIRLEDGTRVRLVQIDAPETDDGECHAARSRRALQRLLPSGTPVRLVADPKLDRRDRYGRKLRYVFRGRRNVNLLLVRQGAAAPYFFEGERGRFAARLLEAAEGAAAAGHGLWGACEAELDPFAALAASKVLPPPPPPPAASSSFSAVTAARAAAAPRPELSPELRGGAP